MTLETQIIQFVLENLEGILGLLGIGGVSTQIKALVNFFDSDNEEANTAPGILKLFTNVRTWTMSEATLAKIKAAVPASEMQAVINAIEAAQEARKASYQIITTLGTICIEYGEVINPEILTSSIVTTASTQTDTTSMNSEKKKIGLLSLSSLLIAGKPVISGMEMKVSEIVGKKCVAGYKGEDYGDVIMGFFFDGELFGEGTCYTKPSVSEYLSAKMPDHDSDYPKGTHILEIKQGYRDGWSSYDGTPGSSGDQNTFKEELTNRYEIIII